MSKKKKKKTDHQNSKENTKLQNVKGKNQQRVQNQHPQKTQREHKRDHIKNQTLQARDLRGRTHLCYASDSTA